MTEISEFTAMERINYAIKLTSSLISVVNEFLWGVDEVPDDLKNFLELFQSLGKLLSGFRNGCPGEQEFYLFVFQKINMQNGPLDECVAELSQLHLRIKSDKDRDEGPARLGWLLDKYQLLQYTLRIQKHKSILALASQLMKDQSKLSEIMAASYPQDTTREKGKHRSEPPTNSLGIGSVETMQRRRSDLKWLFPGDFESRYLGIRERRIKGTGEWLLQHPTFKNWMNGNPGCTVLWGCAKPGAGKTFISSKVIDHIKSQAPIHNSAVGYYFFDHMEKDRVSHKDILSSLIGQLALHAPCFPVVYHTLISRLWPDYQEPKPSLEKLFNNLIETSKFFDQVFFIFDGVDEDNQHEEFLLKFVQNMAVVKMSVFITSNSPPINFYSSLHAIARIDLSARAEDINMSIEKWVDNSQQFRLRLEEGKCQDRFVKEMKTCANGM
ncbi:hypothetical protein DFP73DRAFT_197875 [Morchella snyderi]|nr:hypothetical protein DFP73DRAFT_197875 [Morchella snyderi]